MAQDSISPNNPGSGRQSIDTPLILSRPEMIPMRRLAHVATAIGDSRPAAIWADNVAGQRRNRSSNSPLNMANALLGHRFVIGETFGASGDRTDQALARLNAALATNAGMLYIQCGLNDVGQDYPSAATSGATAFANIKTMAEAARAAGMVVVIEMEVGSNTVSAAQVQQIVELNARLYEYGEVTPSIYIHDARPAVLQGDFSATLINYKTGYAYDGVHTNARGAAYWGESLATLLSAISSPRFGLLPVNRYELVGVGRRQMLANANFNSGTGGTLGPGITGTVPASWLTAKSAAASCAVSVAPKANGIGNEVTLDCTFTAAGEFARIYQDVASTANWDAGEAYEAIARARINGSPSALNRIELRGQSNTTPAGSINFTDGVQDSTWLGPDKAMTLTLLSRPFIIPALTTKGWLNNEVRVVGSGPGTVSVTIELAALRRRDGGY